MDTLKLGQIIEAGREAQRDATHIAVAPVEVASYASPGMRVTIHDGKAYPAEASWDGVIDPFLDSDDDLRSGQRVWVYLRPGSITGLRHEWTHPAFIAKPEKPDASYSEQWLRRYAVRVNTYLSPDDAYETLMRDIRNRAITYHGQDMHSLGDLEDADELREHASRVLGYQVRWEDFEYFSCTC